MVTDAHDEWRERVAQENRVIVLNLASEVVMIAPDLEYLERESKLMAKLRDRHTHLRVCLVVEDARSSRLKLYRLSYSAPMERGDFISAIVVAQSEEQARAVHPRGGLGFAPDSPIWRGTWPALADIVAHRIGYSTDPKHKAGDVVMAEQYGEE